MRAALWVFVSATVAVAWIAAVRAVSSRATSRQASAVAMEHPPMPSEAPLAEDQPAGVEDSETRTERAVARIEVTPADKQALDSVPVDVILVDGENGDVLRCTTTSVERGPEATVEFGVLAPDGYVEDGDTLRPLKAYVSRRAERMRVVEPLRREADIRVRVVDTEGRPVGGARVTGAFRGGRAPYSDEPYAVGMAGALVSSGPSVADGWLRVRGVPHLLDERYWIVVGKAGSQASVEVLVGAFGEKHAVEAILPVASTRPPAATVGLGGGGGGGSARGRGGRRVQVVPATVEVVVLRKDGRLGAGLQVWVGGRNAVTDGSARALFEGLPPGTWAVEVRDPDFIWAQAQVELRAGERRSFVLSEGTGWAAGAVLLDSTGRTVPFARVEIASKAPAPYVRVQDGVQDLVVLTDVNGAISVPDLHHAPVTLTFRYGTRSASATLTESEPLATVRLPPP